MPTQSPPTQADKYPTLQQHIIGGYLSAPTTTTDETANFTFGYQQFTILYSFEKSMRSHIFATTLQKLNITRKYKTFINAFLLAVYAFIATPVQIWHHHNYDTKTISEKSSREKQLASFSKFSQQSVDANCQMCYHHYSIFIDAEIVSLEAPFIFAQSVEHYYVFFIPPSPFLHFSNKGPPALS